MKTEKEMKGIATLLLNIMEKQNCTPKEVVTITDILHKGVHASYTQYLIEVSKEN
jgi:hypothetical protein